jgi:hypothetical protein
MRDALDRDRAGADDPDALAGVEARYAEDIDDAAARAGH